MSMTAQFVANHKQILSAGPCMLIKEHGSPHPSVAHNLRNIGDTGYFEQGAGNQYYGIEIRPIVLGMGSIKAHSARGGMEAISVVGEQIDEGVRYLDYYASACTALAIDSAAKVVLTGPLEGCFIGVGRHFQNYYLFHANDNTTTLDNPKNATNKIKMIRDAALGYWGCNLTHLLMASTYKTDGAYRAFVYGVKNGVEWNFYYHCAVYDGNNWKVKTASDPLPMC